MAVRFVYDFNSPYAYLTASRIEEALPPELRPRARPA
jgi:2-hydroxychromene-2-carboxylate isomerase